MQGRQDHPGRARDHRGERFPAGVCFTANLRDLSAAKAAAAEIERQREALHQSEKLAALGSLLAGVAHELNNPLSVVLGQATMLREELAAGGAMRNRRVKRAEQIQAAAERCARVVRSFMAIASQHKAEEAPVRGGAAARRRDRTRWSTG